MAKEKVNKQRLMDKIEADTLVEFKKSYGGKETELSIYETYESAQKVQFEASETMLVGMICGKKVMHLEETQKFDFLPGQTMFIPKSKNLLIDFPEASIEQPTKCLTLAYSKDKVQEFLDYLNTHYPKSLEKDEEWTFALEDKLPIIENEQVNQSARKLVNLHLQDHDFKDMMLDVAAMELLVNLIQTNQSAYLLRCLKNQTYNGRFKELFDFIDENIGNKINIDTFAEKACMSRPTFYRYFKRQTGMTPIEFLNRRRMQEAQKLLLSTDLTISEVGFEVGFQNNSFFTKTFKKYFGVGPFVFRRQNKYS